MREIKFRAWGESIPGTSEWGHKMIPWEVVKEWGIGFLAEHATIMMYTGLKDKNGKEIYEGDILATSNKESDGITDQWTLDENGYTKVLWDEENARFTYSLWFPTDDTDSIYGWQYVEVIGNIYENPELLTKEQ